MRRCVLPLLLLAGCGHSEPFVASSYGEVGPLIPGPEARIAGALGGQWTENGAGILFTANCYLTNPALNRKRTPPDTGIIGGMQVIPATGGSITWERCETRPEYAQSTDTIEVFPALAMGANGRLLYSEVIRDFYDRPPARRSNFPAFAHADLWLADSGAAFTNRRKLLTLYRNDAFGHAVVPASAINYLINAQWAGPATFVTEALNLLPDGTLTAFGLAQGEITPDTTMLTVLPGTSEHFRWSTAENGTSVVFVSDTVALAIRRTALSGGTPTIVATVPAAGGRRIHDISCRGDLCLVLTQQSGSSTFWTLTLSTGALVPVRTDPGRYSSAKLSPAGNLVLVGEADGMHLFSELLH